MVTFDITDFDPCDCAFCSDMRAEEEAMFSACDCGACNEFADDDPVPGEADLYSRAASAMAKVALDKLAADIRKFVGPMPKYDLGELDPKFKVAVLEAVLLELDLAAIEIDDEIAGLLSGELS